MSITSKQKTYLEQFPLYRYLKDIFSKSKYFDIEKIYFDLDKGWGWESIVYKKNVPPYAPSIKFNINLALSRLGPTPLLLPKEYKENLFSENEVKVVLEILKDINNIYPYLAKPIPKKIFDGGLPLKTEFEKLK